MLFSSSQLTFEGTEFEKKRSTSELWIGDTNIVVVKAKKAKSVPEVTEFEIDTLDFSYFVIITNDRTKDWRLLLYNRTLRNEWSPSSGTRFIGLSE